MAPLSKATHLLAFCQPLTLNLIFLVPNIEEEAKKLAGRDGEIKWGEFYRFAMGTELCKSDFQDRVFHKVDLEDEKEKEKARQKKESTKKAKVRIKTIKAFLPIQFLNVLLTKLLTYHHHYKALR